MKNRRSTVILNKIVNDIEKNNILKKRASAIYQEAPYKPLEQIIEHDVLDLNMQTFMKSFQGTKRKSIITARDISSHIKSLYPNLVGQNESNENSVKREIKWTDDRLNELATTGFTDSKFINSKGMMTPHKSKSSSLKLKTPLNSMSLTKSKTQRLSIGKAKKAESNSSSEDSYFSGSDMSFSKAKKRIQMVRFSKAFSPEYYVGKPISPKSKFKTEAPQTSDLPIFIQNLIMGEKSLVSKEKQLKRNEQMYRNATILFKQLMEAESSNSRGIKSKIASCIHTTQSIISETKDFTSISRQLVYLIDLTKDFELKSLNLFLIKIFSKVLLIIKEYGQARIWIKKGLFLATKGECFFEKMVFFKYMGRVCQEKSELAKARSYFLKVLHYAWTLKNIDFEMTAYDLLGINHFLSGDIEYAKFYHDKMIGGKSEDEKSVARAVATSSVRKRIQIRKKFRETFGREKDTSSEEEESTLFNMKVKQGETQNDLNLNQKLLSSGSKWKTPKNFEFKVTFLRKGPILLSHLSRNRSLANYNREAGRMIYNNNEQPIEILITNQEAEKISKILRKAKTTFMMLLAVFKVKIQCEEGEGPKSRIQNELRLTLSKVRSEESKPGTMLRIEKRSSKQSTSKFEEYYYKELGVSPKASSNDIKKAFYALAKKHHPDVNGGNDNKFKALSEAWEVLGDEGKKKEYDSARNPASSNASPFNTSNPFRNQQSGFKPSPGSSTQGFQNSYDTRGKYNEQFYTYYSKDSSSFDDPQMKEYIRKAFEEAQKRKSKPINMQSQWQSQWKNQNYYERDPNPASSAEMLRRNKAKLEEEIIREREYERVLKEKEEKFVKDVEQKIDFIKEKVTDFTEKVSYFAEKIGNVADVKFLLK